MAENTSKKKRAGASKQTAGRAAPKKKTASAAKKKTKAASKKAAAKKAPVKKSAAKKTAPKKSTAKKSTAKKPPAPRKVGSLSGGNARGKASRTSATASPAAPAGRAGQATLARKERTRRPAPPQGELFPEVTAVPHGRAVFEEDLVFPKDFLWGAATSATQIDGGDEASDWFEFCSRPGRIADGSSPAVACDHWNRYEEDFAVMRSLGLNAYRLGVDWSRFEPEPGQWNFAALDHFRAMLASLNQKKIRPLLTLNHFTLPRWWQARGGWTRETNLPDFYKFVEFLVAGVGDLVHEYVTINEPNVYAYFGYLEGIWPPGKSGLSGYLRGQQVQRNMLLAHFALYDTIRELHGSKNFAAPKIGAAMHYQIMDPLRPGNRLDEDRASAANYRFNEAWTDGIATGTLPRPLGNGKRVHDGEAWDFYGLNYYSRRLVSFSPFALGQLFIRSEINPDAPHNDLGWEIYPEGLTRVLMHVHEKYRLPIRITENGIAADNDQDRVRFLQAHLDAMEAAMRRGVPVEAYYHWSLLDNFEWAEGYTARFGLLGVDFQTQKRTVRESARAYGDIIKSHS